MKLLEYSNKLKELAEKYPNIDVVYSIDDEGNDFKIVNYSPTLGEFEDNEFHAYHELDEDQYIINSVCIN